MRKLDLTNQKFGRLTALYENGNPVLNRLLIGHSRMATTTNCKLTESTMTKGIFLKIVGL